MHLVLPKPKRSLFHCHVERSETSLIISVYGMDRMIRDSLFRSEWEVSRYVENHCRWRGR
jgi:hypothetical protein